MPSHATRSSRSTVLRPWPPIRRESTLALSPAPNWLDAGRYPLSAIGDQFWPKAER